MRAPIPRCLQHQAHLVVTTPSLRLGVVTVRPGGEPLRDAALPACGPFGSSAQKGHAAWRRITAP